jgi:putative MFS transporter
VRRARPSAADRLDRLPIASFHREITWLLGFVFFFELGDINTFSFAAPALLKAWHLSVSTISVIVSATFLGMFVGATTGGWFSDRVGRKRALVVTVAWYSAFSMLNACVWDTRGLFVARLLTGVGLSAMTVVAITYVSEMFPARWRGTYQGWIMTIGLIGIPATAYVARFTVPIAEWGWRFVFLWGSAGLLFLLFAHRLEESPRWYERVGRLADADEALDRIEARTRVDVGRVPPVSPSAPPPPGRRRYVELFSRANRRVTLALIVAWICETQGFYGFTAWVPTLLVAHGFPLVQSLAWSSAISIGAVPGALITALVSDRWDRKWLISTVTVIVAVCGLIYGMTFRTTTILIFGFLVAMFLQTCASLFYAYTPECFPTEVRNSGAGLAYGLGRLANAGGPLLIAFIFTRYGYRSVFVYITLMFLLVSATVAAFGPATKGRALA